MNQTITPKKLKVLRALLDGQPHDDCGRPTKQALVRDGLAVYTDETDPQVNQWDRPIRITDRGRRAATRGTIESLRPSGCACPPGYIGVCHACKARRASAARRKGY